MDGMDGDGNDDACAGQAGPANKPFNINAPAKFFRRGGTAAPLRPRKRFRITRHA